MTLNFGIVIDKCWFSNDNTWTTLEDDYIAFLLPAHNALIELNKF
jgi:hypothetical protein